MTNPVMIERPFHYIDGELCAGRLPLRQIAEKTGTPCYVYVRSAIEQNYRFLREVFQKVNSRIFFAVKANSNLSVLKILKEQGCGFDVVSGGELFRLQHIGADPKGVIFSGVGKTCEEIRNALRLGIFCLNVESLQEMEQLVRILASENRPVSISLRLNPDREVESHPYISTGMKHHKFGIDAASLKQVLALIAVHPRLQLVGLSFHLGSQILNVDPFLEVFDRTLHTADELTKQGFPIRHIDIGGGFGIRYRDEPLPDLRRAARELAERQGPYQIFLEPGRCITGNTGVLLNRVLLSKENQGKRFIVVDGAMNDLLRPALYQAYHEIQPLKQRNSKGTADVVGPVCESGDFFARDRLLPELGEGDYLAVMDTGAYGFVASSNYNSRRRCAEVLVEGESWRIIRRRESYLELVQPELDGLHD